MNAYKQCSESGFVLYGSGYNLKSEQGSRQPFFSTEILIDFFISSAELIILSIVN